MTFGVCDEHVARVVALLLLLLLLLPPPPPPPPPLLSWQWFGRCFTDFESIGGEWLLPASVTRLVIRRGKAGINGIVEVCRRGRGGEAGRTLVWTAAQADRQREGSDSAQRAENGWRCVQNSPVKGPGRSKCSTFLL